MKRFLLFGGDTYYPRGGMDDFKGDYDTIDEAKNEALLKRYCDWIHIYDQETRQFVFND